MGAGHGGVLHGAVAPDMIRWLFGSPLCCPLRRQPSGHWAQGMEVYSTVLWHLKRDVELAHLAQEALAQDRRAARAWAIAGNCFSLQKVGGPASPSGG